MNSVLRWLVHIIPPHFHWINHYRLFSSLVLWSLCWPNQSRNIWCHTAITLLWAFKILDAIVKLYLRFVVCLPVIFALIWIINVSIPVKQVLGVQHGVMWTIHITFGWMAIILFIWRTFNSRVYPLRKSFVDKAGGKCNLSDNWDAVVPLCWRYDNDTLVSSIGWGNKPELQKYTGNIGWFSCRPIQTPDQLLHSRRNLDQYPSTSVCYLVCVDP